MPKLTFTPIPLEAMQTNMGNPGFSQLVAGDLGSDGTATDGFDAILAGLAQAITDEGSFLPTLDSFIGAMDFTPGALAGSLLNPLISDFAAFLSSSNPLAAAIDSAIATGVPAPPVPKAPVVISAPIVTAPVHGGGGGGTGGFVVVGPPEFDPLDPGTWGNSGDQGLIYPRPPMMETL